MELLLRELNKWMKIKVKKSKIQNFTLFVFRKTLCNSAVVQRTEKIICGPIWEYGRIVYKKTWIYFQLYLFMYIYITYIPFFCSIKKTDKHQHAQFHGPIVMDQSSLRSIICIYIKLLSLFCLDFWSKLKNPSTDLPKILIGELGRTTEMFFVWFWDSKLDWDFLGEKSTLDKLVKII